MATKILAHPMDDKRKASVVTLSFDSDGDSDIVDIRGFANFTVIVTTTLASTTTIKVCATVDGTFVALNSLGSSAAAVAKIPVTNNEAYDVPELAGCHYLKFVLDSGTTGAITIMGKV